MNNNKNFFEQFINRPVLAWVINIVIIVLGIVAWQKLDVREYPKIQFPTISVRIEYPGASTTIVESQITCPFEEAFAGMPGLDSMESSSMTGQSQIVLNFTSDTRPEDAAAEVRDRVARVKGDLPQGLRDPVISKSSLDSQDLMRIAVYSEKYNLAELADMMERSKGLFGSIPGVASAQILGGSGGSDSSSFQIHAIFNPQKAFMYDVSIKEIREAIYHHSFKSPLGEITNNDIGCTITIDQAAKTVEDYKNVIVKSTKNGMIYLKDVCDVKLVTHDKDSISRYNGKPCIIMSIVPQQGENPIQIAKNVREMMEEVKKTLPDSVKMTIGFDGSIAIDKSIKAVYRSIIEAVIFVFLIMFLFLRSWRSTFIPMITIPICIFGGFFFVYIFGFSVNKITLLAMVLAIGLVVDDAIVVLENIHRYIEKGMSPMMAAVHGINEIKFAVIAMTLTLMAVYVPIIFAKGMVGKLFTEFAITLAGTVLISGVVALVLTPMLCSRILKQEHVNDKNENGLFKQFTNKIEHLLQSIDNWYKNFLTKCLDNAIWIFSISFFIGMSAFFSTYYLPKTLIPDEDTGYIFLNMEAPTGANAKYFNNYITPIENKIRKMPWIENVGVFIQSNSNRNTIFISTVELEQRKKSCQQILDDIIKEIEGIQAGISIRGHCYGGAIGNGNQSSKTVSFAIQSHKEYDEMEEVVQKIIGILRSYNDVLPTIMTTRAKPEKTYTVKINSERAAKFNVNMHEIGEMLSCVMRGQPPADRFEERGHRYPMRLMMEDDFKSNPNNIMLMHVRAYRSNNNEKAPPLIPLYELLEIFETMERPVAVRYEGMRSYSITCELKNGNPTRFFTKFADRLRQEGLLPIGYKISPTGELRKAIKEGEAILLIFLLAIILIFLIMAAQFESFSDPFIIMFSVPLALAGGVLVLIPTGGSLNIFTYIAMITLVGLIAKHGILIVEFANHILLQKISTNNENDSNNQNANIGKTMIYDSVKEAAVLRLRPILMTTAAMVLGALPLALSRSTGHEIHNQIGWVIVSGMLIGTLFTIFLVPCVYLYIKRAQRRSH